MLSIFCRWEMEELKKQDVLGIEEDVSGLLSVGDIGQVAIWRHR